MAAVTDYYLNRDHLPADALRVDNAEDDPKGSAAMRPDASQEYLRNSVMTASPEQLQLMLYDGAIRFGTQALEALQRQDYSESCELLLRTQKIVLELQNGLRPEVNPQLCQQLASLYQFIYRRLVDANMARDAEALDDALQILRHQRESWEMLLTRLRGDGGSQSGQSTLTPDEPARTPISMEC